MTALFDSHAHLQEPEYEEDLEIVIADARAAGVNEVLLPGEDVTTSQRAAMLATFSGRSDTCTVRCAVRFSTRNARPIGAGRTRF